MPATYEPITTTTLSSAILNLDITSIPGTYTDLKVIMTGVPSANDTLQMRFNSNTSNYSRTRLSGDGSDAASGRNTNQTRFTIADNKTTQPFFVEFDIFNYAGSTHKTMLYSYNLDRNGNGEVVKGVALWRNTAAITELNFFNQFGANFNSGTTVTIYGILKA